MRLSLSLSLSRTCHPVTAITFESDGDTAMETVRPWVTGPRMRAPVVGSMAMLTGKAKEAGSGRLTSAPAVSRLRTCLMGCFKAYMRGRLGGCLEEVFRGVFGCMYGVHTCITGVHKCNYGNDGVHRV